MTQLRIGVTLPQFTADAHRFLGAAERATAVGLDSIWVFDHLWPLSGGKTRNILEGWTALAYLAAATQRLTLGTLVTRSTLRHPAVLGKMVATVATVAPGRIIVGLGSGDQASRAENESFGLPYFSGRDRLEQFEATADLVRHYLREQRVDLDGRFVEVRGLPPSPRPSVVPPVWMAGRSPEVLELAGRSADGWNAWAATPDEFELEAAQVRAAAAGRPITLTWAGLALIAPSDAEARAKLGRRNPDDYLLGGVETVAARLRALAHAGAEHAILTFPDAGDPGPYELLGEARAALG